MKGSALFAGRGIKDLSELNLDRSRWESKTVSLSYFSPKLLALADSVSLTYSSLRSLLFWSLWHWLSRKKIDSLAIDTRRCAPHSFVTFRSTTKLGLGLPNKVMNTCE